MLAFVRVLALVMAPGLAVAAANDSAEIIKWVPKLAVPPKTVRPGSDFADLKPLKSMVGDARIVSLGEATHGSRELFQMKHR